MVGTIWDTFLGDLRLWGLLLGAGGLIVAAAFEPGGRGAVRRLSARAVAPSGAAGRLARAAVLLVLAALLVWMPEVPLDLALVTAAGALRVHSRGGGRARVFHSVIVARSRGRGRLPELWRRSAD